MLTQTLEFLKLLLDPETRRTLSVVSSHLVKSDGEWKRRIKTLRARFSGHEEYKARGFGSFLLEELKGIGLPAETVEDCRVVLDELVTNAFYHGCDPSARGWVRLSVTYSPWFVRIEVRDSGKGFNLKNTLSAPEILGEEHGLQIVNKLCYQLEANKRGNSIVGFLAAEGSLKLTATSEIWRRKDIAVIKIDNLEKSFYVKKSWEVLRHALRNAKQNAVLVDFRLVGWSSRRIGEARTLLIEAGLRRDGRRYALIVNRNTGRIFNMDSLRASNIEIFVCQSDQDIDRVKDWLVGHGGEESTLHELAPEIIFGEEPVVFKPPKLQSESALAKISFADLRGEQVYFMTKSEIIIGREAPDIWVDLRLETAPDVSREHVRIRRTHEGAFQLKDLSRLGTTVNGALLPRSLQMEKGEVRDLDRWIDLPNKAKIGLADVIHLDFEVLEDEGGRY